MSAEEEFEIDDIPEEELAKLLTVERSSLDKLLKSKGSRERQLLKDTNVIEKDYTQWKEKNKETITKYNKLIKDKEADKDLQYTIPENQTVATVLKKLQEVEKAHSDLKEIYDRDIEILDDKYHQQERQIIRNRHLRYLKEIEEIEKQQGKDKQEKEEEDRLIEEEKQRERLEKEKEQRKQQQKVEKEQKLKALKKRRQLRKTKRDKELEALSRQYVALSELIESADNQLTDPGLTKYQIELVKRRTEKFHVVRHIAQHRKERREKITLGDRLDTDEDTETEISDGGFSALDSEEDYHKSAFPVQEKAISRSKKRFKKPKKRDFEPKGDKTLGESGDSSSDEGEGKNG